MLKPRGGCQRRGATVRAVLCHRTQLRRSGRQVDPGETEGNPGLSQWVVLKSTPDGRCLADGPKQPTHKHGVSTGPPAEKGPSC
ncbi:unnamed protein product [Arctogadus glacialis]